MKIQKNIKIIDGVFSIETRLELAGIAGQVSRAESICNLHINNGPTGVCQPSLRCLNQFLMTGKEINC